MTASRRCRADRGSIPTARRREDTHSLGLGTWHLLAGSPLAPGTFAARALDRGASSPIPARLHFPPVRPGVGADDPTSCADHPRAEGADENGVAPLVCAEHSLVGALFLSKLDIHMSKRARPAIPMADLIVSFALMGIAISPT